MTPDQISDVYHDEAPETTRERLLPLANAGNPVAQFYMGHLCDELSPRDQEQAYAWYQKSSDGGFLEGTHYLASFTYHGMGTPRDIETALLLFRTSAEAGLDASQWKLGQHLLLSDEDREEAIRWLKLAAAQGHPAAADLLSENGEDI
jgi:TPR repeat protein